MNQLFDIFIGWITANPWVTPIVAFFAGVLTSLMPCSLSTIPLIIGYVGGSDTVDEHGKGVNRALMLSLLFAIGSTIVFCILGMIASAIGTVLDGAEFWIHIIMSVLLVLMALQMWGMISILPNDSSMLARNKLKGSIGALLSGIIAGLFASHCSLPVVIALMAVAANADAGGISYGPLLLLLFSMGHAVLSVIAGTSAGFVQKLTTNMKYEKLSKLIKLLLGIFIMLIAVYLFVEALREGIAN